MTKEKKSVQFGKLPHCILSVLDYEKKQGNPWLSKDQLLQRLPEKTLRKTLQRDLARLSNGKDYLPLLSRYEVGIDNFLHKINERGEKVLAKTNKREFRKSYNNSEIFKSLLSSLILFNREACRLSYQAVFILSEFIFKGRDINDISYQDIFGKHKLSKTYQEIKQSNLVKQMSNGGEFVRQYRNLNIGLQFYPRTIQPVFLDCDDVISQYEIKPHEIYSLMYQKFPKTMKEYNKAKSFDDLIELTKEILDRASVFRQNKSKATKIFELEIQQYHDAKSSELALPKRTYNKIIFSSELISDV